MDLETLKSDAAREALRFVTSGMRLGLGTGSTVSWFLEHLAAALRSGALGEVAGVPTSVRTEQRCRELGIPLLTLSDAPLLDVVVDGADEIDPRLDLVKGLGGALLREKMVARAGASMVVISDHTKLVERLGTRAPLPVEVVTFAWRSHLPFLRELGAEPVLRANPQGAPYLTDNGNHILDCSFPAGIVDAPGLDRALLDRPGILDHGLFLGLARSAVVATPTGIEIRGASPGQPP